MNGYAGQAEMAKTAIGLDRVMGIRERLQGQKDEYTARLARVQAALDALDANPAVATALEAVMKAL